MRINVIVHYVIESIFPLLLCLFWLFPVTIFGFWTQPIGTEVFSDLRFPLLTIALIFIISWKLDSVNISLLAFIVVSLCSSLLSNDFVYSGIKFLGLGVTIGVVSPLLLSRTSLVFRDVLWKNICWSAVFVTLLSVFIELFGIPIPEIYFKEGFPGITSHAMMFAPITALAGIFLFSKAFAEKNVFSLLLAVICYMTIFSTLSRSAIAALTVAIILVILVGLPKGKFSLLRWLLILFLLPFLLVVSNQFGELGLDILLNVDAFAEKGIDTYSREELWNSRLTEFETSPILGLGVGMSSEYSSGASGFAGSVEPGSGYLLVLSMTGILGAVALLIVLIMEIMSVSKVWQMVPKRIQFELIGIGTFLFLHAGAEGWIYAPGGFICIFFWAWLGRIGDTANRIRFYR